MLYGSLTQHAFAQKSVHVFDLPPQKIDSALLNFANQSGLQILFDPEVINAMNSLSGAVIGPMSASSALSHILASTPLEYAFLESSIIVIRQRVTPKAESHVPIQPKRVDGEVEEVLSIGMRNISKIQQFRQSTSVGSIGSVRKLDASNTVSTMGEKSIRDLVIINTADIFRSLPGFRSEAAGGEGSNPLISLRGLPVAGSAAKFLQLQEDGFPVVQFGDIIFGSAIGLIRQDFTLHNIESIRGGSAATFASNGPGGIVNFVSNTGAENGGLLGLTAGLDHDRRRIDFQWGGQLREDIHGSFGGFFRTGEGVRRSGYRGNHGGQFKANLTKLFSGGYVRFYLKHLDDNTITFFPMPIQANGEPIASFDSLDYTLHSAYFSTDLGLDANNRARTTNIHDGAEQNLTFLGMQTSVNLDAKWSLDYRIGQTSMRGNWVSPFPAELGAAQAIANTTARLIPAANLDQLPSLRYANGPYAGQAFDAASANDNGLAMRIHLFNAQLNDLGSFSQDLRLSRALPNGALTLGFYQASQDIDTHWQWNSYLMEVRGDNAALLDVFDGDGVQLSDGGLYAYGTPYWGWNGQRRYDLSYDIFAPYVNWVATYGQFNADLSLRYDIGKAGGVYIGQPRHSDASPVLEIIDLNGDGILQVPETRVAALDLGHPSPVDYDWRYISYSAGISLALNEHSSLFARLSHGARANADSLPFSRVKADGSVRDEDSIDPVDQFELGYRLEQKNVGVSATLFSAKTEEQSYDQTQQRFLNKQYRAFGLELEGVYQWGNVSVDGSLTLTDAKIRVDQARPSNEGNVPSRQPNILYTLTSSYLYRNLNIGFSLTGAGKAYAQDTNELMYDPYLQVNTFAYVRFNQRIRLLLKTNNIFDEVALTEILDANVVPIDAPGSVANGAQLIRGRTYPGRSSTLSIQYSF